MSDEPVGTVRVHPEGNPNDPDATRIIRVAVAHATEWPWRRLTGLPTNLPARDTDLDDWPVQPLGDLAAVLEHPTILTGREVHR